MSPYVLKIYSNDRKDGPTWGKCYRVAPSGRTPRRNRPCRADTPTTGPCVSPDGTRRSLLVQALPEQALAPLGQLPVRALGLAEELDQTAEAASAVRTPGGKTPCVSSAASSADVSISPEGVVAMIVLLSRLEGCLRGVSSTM